MPVKGSGVGRPSFRYGLFQEFMTSSGLLFPLSEVLSTPCALQCSVVCAGSSLALTFVTVAAVATVVQGFPLTPFRGRAGLSHGSSSREAKVLFACLWRYHLPSET